jgi:SAM-dependent methyltransferase
MLDEINKTISPCRICGSREFHVLIRNLPRAGYTWNLHSCNRCGFGTTFPLPDETLLSSLYSEEYWDSSTDRLVDAFYDLRMKRFALRLRNLAPKGAKALDVGAGNGMWVKLLARCGFNAVGIDPYASEAENGIIYRCGLEDTPFQRESFNLITFMNVLEHINDPVGSIRQALRLLHPEGLLAIEVPNLLSLGFAWFRMRWYPLDIPWHVNHFTPSSLQLALDQAGAFQTIYFSGFSLRDCPSSLANSLLPGLAPRTVREHFRGSYPFSLKLVYLLTQAVCLPVSAANAMAGRGEIIRAIFRYK